MTITRQSSSSHTKVAKKEIEDIYPLSAMQEGILFHSLIDATNKQGVYHQQLLWDLNGPLDVMSFSRAWEAVIANHTIMRTGFFWKELEKPIQVVFRELPVEVKLEDWTGASSDEQEELIQQFLTLDRQTPFILDQPLLMRLMLFKRSVDCYTFVWSHHHIILDGWSVAIVLGQVMEAYEQLVKRQNIHVRRSAHYVEYIKWLLQQDNNLAEIFWKKELAGFQTPLSCQENGQTLTHIASYHEIEKIIPQGQFQKLQDWSRKERITLATLLQGAWALLLRRFCSTNDVLFGVTISGRPNQMAGADEMVGLFINTLPLRINVDVQAVLKDWLIQEVQQQQHQLKDWEHVPLMNVQGWSEVPRGQQLFESILVFENYPIPSQQAHSISIQQRCPVETTNYPLTLSVGIVSGALSIKLNYDEAAYSNPMINSLLEYMETLLLSFPKYAERPLSELPILSSHQEVKLTQGFQGISKSFPEEITLSQSFEQYSQTAPDTIAIIDGEESFTYEQINQQANQLARGLRAKGVQEEDIVAIGMSRSKELIISILAIWKLGAAYVPLDLSHPPKRLLQILEDCSAKHLIVRGTVGLQIGERITVYDLDNEKSDLDLLPSSNLIHKHKMGRLAYVLFTSGSTGIPKTVLVEHGSLMNIAQGWADEYRLRNIELRLLQIANATFDVFVGDLARCFFNCGTLVICPDEARLDLPAFYKLISDHRITIFESTPGLILLN